MALLFLTPTAEMTTLTLNLDLGAEAASSLETVADTLEATLAQLDRLGDAAGPGGDRDADFQLYRRQIHAALLALRGRGLHLTDEQARQCRHLWEAAFALTSQDLEAYPLAWYGAVQSLAGVLPHVEEAKP